MSLAFQAAAAEWRRVRHEYQVHLEAQYVAAWLECNGNLLNARGRAADVDPRTLFMGPRSRATAYASEDLLAFWNKHTRMTFAEFEQASYTWAVTDGS